MSDDDTGLTERPGDLYNFVEYTKDTRPLSGYQHRVCMSQNDVFLSARIDHMWRQITQSGYVSAGCIQGYFYQQRYISSFIRIGVLDIHDDIHDSWTVSHNRSVVNTSTYTVQLFYVQVELCESGTSSASARRYQLIRIYFWLS